MAKKPDDPRDHDQGKGNDDKLSQPKATEPERAKTIEEAGIGKDDPYPTGNPRDPEDDFVAAHGFKRAKE